MSEPYRANTPVATGTVTLLFTDIEGSTALWEQDGARMSQALAAHDVLARSAVEAHYGRVVKLIGDGILAVFDDARDALAATVDLQQSLADAAATNGISLRVRCGLHAGAVERRDNDYFGSPVNRAARIMGAAHGGEVLVSQAVVDSVRERLPVKVSLRDLGRVRLKDLSIPEHVYRVVHPDLRREFPALRLLEATPNNLPQQLTSFVGREKESAQLQRLLAKTRLLTLTGSGGCGKTRLGLQVAADALEQYPDGVWLVELAPLADSGLVPQAVASVLGLKEESGKPITQTLTDYLTDEWILLLLDNCEHVLDGCARLVDTIARQCPQVTILASSREALGIGGEQTYRVPSLLLPDPNRMHTLASVAPFEAVQLFTDRAMLARPHFEVTEQNASTLASICYQLDGIPLAIELAAPRLRSMSVEELSQRLDQRFALLTDGSRTALPRHRTLRSMIDWSYDLLTDVEQAMLRRVSVFAGGWTLAAAEQVCMEGGIEKTDTIGLLTSLADKNLVITEEHEGATRYRMLETVRQYALDRLRETDEEVQWRRRHFAWVLALAEESFAPLTGPDQGLWLDRMARELDNFRAALQWAIDQKLPDAFRMAPNLSRWWIRRAHLREAREWFSRLLDAIPRDQAKRDRARALNAVGNLALNQCDYDEAERLFRESLALFRELGNARGSAYTQTNLALLAMARAQYTDAEPLLVECAALARILGDAHLLAVNLGNLAVVVHARGDGDRAATLFEESLTLARDGGDSFLISEVLGARGRAECKGGDLESAKASLVESLAIASDLADPEAAAEALEGFAELAVATHDLKRAATILGAAARLREETGHPIPVREEREHKRVAAAARAALGDAVFDQAWREGSAMDLEEAARYTLNGRVAGGG